MARNFVSGSSQRGSKAAVPWNNSLPVTISCWVRVLATDTNSFPFGMHYSGNNLAESIRLQTRAGTNTLRAEHRDGAASGSSESSGANVYTEGTWVHIAGVFTSTTSRTSYINGVASTTDTTNIAGTMNVDYTVVGAGRYLTGFVNHYNGDIAECAIWDVELTAAHIAALAAGACPKDIHSGNLTFYAPLIGSGATEPNIWANSTDYSLTMDNSPATAAHSPTQLPFGF